MRGRCAPLETQCGMVSVPFRVAPVWSWFGHGMVREVLVPGLFSSCGERVSLYNFRTFRTALAKCIEVSVAVAVPQKKKIRSVSQPPQARP